MTNRRIAVAGALLVILSSCSISNGGSPVPGSDRLPSDSTPPASTTSAAASSTARLLPPRPRSLDLTGVDPCKDVLTQDQLRQLAYDMGYHRRPQPDNGIDNARTCTYESSLPIDQPSRDIGSLVVVTTSVGAEVWLTDPGRKRGANLARTATVAGFPALVLPHPNFVANCAVVVDVHDGQYLAVDSSPSGGAKGTSPDPYCAEAQRVAQMAIQTLSGGR